MRNRPNTAARPFAMVFLGADGKEIPRVCGEVKRDLRERVNGSTSYEQRAFGDTGAPKPGCLRQLPPRSEYSALVETPSDKSHFVSGVTATSFAVSANLPPSRTTRLKATLVVRFVVVNGLSAVMTK